MKFYAKSNFKKKKINLILISLFEFQENINYMQSVNYQISINQVDNYFADLNTIKAINPNIKVNHAEFYEYLKALIHIHVLIIIKINFFIFFFIIDFNFFYLNPNN